MFKRMYIYIEYCIKIKFLTSDRLATGIDRWSPEETTAVGCVAKDFGLTGCIWWIVRTLGDNWFAFQRFRNTVHVLRSYPEDILFALGKSFGSVAGSRTISRSLSPIVCSVVRYFHDVVGNVGSAIVQWSIPRQGHGLLSGASVLKRTLGWSWSVYHDHLDIG